MSGSVAIAPPTGPARWLPWLVGGVVVATLLAVGLHFSESRSFLELARNARPAWLLLAVVLQVLTYATEGVLWRQVTCRAGCPLTLGQALQLVLGKFFVDQVLPTGGVSGSIMAVSALNKKGVTESVVAAAVVVERVSFLFAYSGALLLALALGLDMSRANKWVTLGGIMFAIVAVVIATTMTLMVGTTRVSPPWLKRVKPLESLLSLLRKADRARARNRVSLLSATALQLGVITLDTFTMLAIVQSLGGNLNPVAVFVSFMVSSLFRTIGVLPGGLGTFEASSTLTLRMAGADLPLALSTTMLFRGFTFWLPMIPGFWFAQRMARRRPNLTSGDTHAEHRSVQPGTT